MFKLKIQSFLPIWMIFYIKKPPNIFGGLSCLNEQSLIEKLNFEFNSNT